MRYLETVMVIHPRATKIRTSEEALASELKKRDAYESKLRKKVRRIIRSIGVFFIGQAIGYIKPVLTKKDCFFIVLHLQINIRFIVLYTDLSLKWGGFLVWVAFSAMNLAICSSLAFMYTFFGDYASRSFLSVWEMNPFFQGISICMVIWETIKAIETGLILSTGLLSISLFFELGENNSNTTFNNCSSPDVYSYIPGWAVPYGVSKKFVALGHSMVSNDYSYWEYNKTRTYWLGVIWFLVIFIRMFQFKRYRIFPMRVAPILLALTFICLVVVAIVSNRNPAIAVVYSNAYMDCFAYMQIFAFSVSDYLPSHWVTIGYLHPGIAKSTLIWTMSCLKNLVGFVIYLAIPYFAQNFREYVNVTNDNCLHFFGIHLIFLIIPLNIQRTSLKYIDLIAYIIYMLLINLTGTCYLLLNMEMLSFALQMKSILINRFRNLLFILMCVVVYVVSQLLSVNAVHIALYYMNFLSHYYTSGIILIITMLGIAIYGLERINADHHFFYGSAYSHLASTKALIVVCSCLSAIYVLDTAIFHVNRQPVDNIYWVILTICLAPSIFGVLGAGFHRKSYHGCFYPLTSWGRPQKLVRIGRRRKDLRKMFIYRTKRQCIHNCLLNHKLLSADVHRELQVRQDVLHEVLDVQRLLLEGPLHQPYIMT